MTLKTRLTLATVALALSACGDSDGGGGKSGARDGGTEGGVGLGGDGSNGGGNSGGGRKGSGGAGNGGRKGNGGVGQSGGGGRNASGGQANAGGDGTAGDPGNGGAGGASGEGGLHVVGNEILTPEGKPFHGRGANLFDTRSCNACAYAPPNVAGLNRWADELFDGWGANFVRFALISWASADNRQQWQSVTQDPGYVADIKNTVSHITAKSGAYVMVTLFTDPSMKGQNQDYDSEWPTADTLPAYEALAEALYDNPKVLFALTNEPHGSADHDPELAKRYLDAIDVIRGVEAKHGAAEHIVVVQAPEGYARYLEYFVANPIARTNVAYEVHVYNHESDYTRLLDEPHKTLPLIVGEYGMADTITEADIRALWARCKTLEIPHLAWSFHMRCPPNLLQDSASDGCGLAPSTGYDFPRTAYGNLVHDYLQTPW